MRLTSVVIASNHWEKNSLDIRSAFLQGSRNLRDLFIKPPPERCITKIWKLQNCVYDLADALHPRYLHVTEELKKLGATKSIYDEAIFCYHHNAKLEGIISTHVDDVSWGGTPNFKKDIIDMINT